jgi:hypothetical protein
MLIGCDGHAGVYVEEPPHKGCCFRFADRVRGGFGLAVDVGDAHHVRVNDTDMTDPAANQGFGGPAPNPAQSKDNDTGFFQTVYDGLPRDEGQPLEKGIYGHFLLRGFLRFQCRFQRKCKLVGTGCGAAPAGSTFQFSDHVIRLHALDELGDTGKVSGAPSLKFHIMYDAVP